MALKMDQIEEEILKLRDEMKEISQRGARIPEDASTPALMNYLKYLVDERERTNRVLKDLTEKISQLERKLNDYEGAEEQETPRSVQVEVPVSALDATILDFIKTTEKQMICADQLKAFMNYKGRNAACARLNNLCRSGFLQKFQLGHKVYYRFDAGKATKALIISPPQ
jgi:predicted  nucleic acid-binding Zn-ribbon protein